MCIDSEFWYVIVGEVCFAVDSECEEMERMYRKKMQQGVVDICWELEEFYSQFNLFF